MKILHYSKLSRAKVSWTRDSEITKRINRLWVHSELPIKLKDSVICTRSQNANTRAYARIWGLPRIWQEALNLTPKYILEVVSEKFDKLREDQQDEVLIHELAHIPKNFSGALVAHTRRGKGSFHGKLRGMIGSYRRLR